MSDDAAGTSRWQVLGERSLYESPWVTLHLLDVVHPGGHRYEHHAVRSTAAAVACAVRRPDGAVLLMWRHRVVPDAWGWEVPAGRVEPGEGVEEAAARETLEETGWTVRDVRRLTGFHPLGGSADQRFEVCLAEAGEQVGPHDPVEADEVGWFSPAQVRALLTDGQVQEGLSVVALLWLLSGLDG
ncbi:NUDIX hydrolase [Aquipuribacter hungaricus]|uniref:NUDIX hydrolase n=1 Tax=Aquipuribacter hungaricus TaxID=545624 RepID=A0ABV7WL03_9MICO